MRTGSLSLSALTVLFLLAAAYKGQNNLILQLNDGASFKVLLKDKPYNNMAQSQVELRNLKDDTLFVKIELEKGERFGVTLYLLEKGKKTSGKEFNYVLHREKNRLRPTFMGMRETRK